VAKVTYAGAATIKWSDSTVKQGRAYRYKVTAFGPILGVSESEYSTVGRVIVNDLTPPGDITFDADEDIRIVNGELFLDYIAPPDEDYIGVRVYLEDPGLATRHILLTTEFGLPNEPDQLSTRLPFAGRYWFRTIDAAGNVQPVGEGVSWDWDGKSRWLRAAQGI